MKRHTDGQWREVTIETDPERAARIHGTYLVVTGTGPEARPILVPDPHDHWNVALDLEGEAPAARVRMQGTDAEAAEYALARGYAHLIGLEDRKPGYRTASSIAAAMGTKLDTEARILVPVRLRRMVVTTTIFGKAVELELVAGSNVGAMMMASHRAAAEAYTAPWQTVREDGRPAEETLPLHPDILNGFRICMDPVRNGPHEPWTWGPQTLDNVDVDRTSLHWHQDAANDAATGWYIALWNVAGDPVEIVGPVHNDAPSILEALADALPGEAGRDGTAGPFPTLGQIAVRGLEAQIEKWEQASETDSRFTLEPQRELHRALQKELEGR